MEAIDILMYAIVNVVKTIDSSLADCCMPPVNTACEYARIPINALRFLQHSFVWMKKIQI
jgi:hypothetical protein